MRRPELLIPASSLEVLKTAVIYGADAVYIGGEAFGLRVYAVVPAATLIFVEPSASLYPCAS